MLYSYYYNTNLLGSLLQFSVEDKTAFEIPLNQVNKSTKNKNEVTIEFHQSDEAPVSLVEMRFHIPTNQEDEQDPVKVCPMFSYALYLLIRICCCYN